MPKRAKPISKLHQFLIENTCANDADSINEVKRLYWNKQKALWRQQQRKNTKSITINLSKREYASITAQAKRHKRSRVRFVKDAALAYETGTFLQLSTDLADILREGYLLNFHALNDLREASLLPEHIGIEVIQALERLRLNIESELNNPKRIEAAIEDIIRTNPENRQKLIDLLNRL